MPTKILVVDDSATMRRVLQMTFAGEDAQVIAVDNGEAGVAKAAELTPDVVFADTSMQGVDGYELTRRIKTNPALSRTAVIVMASQHNPYDDGKGRSAGVDDHISKPFDTQGVIDRVAQVLARPRNQTALGGGEPARAPAPPAPAARPAPPAAPAPAPARSPATHGTRMGIGGPVPLQPPPAVKPPVAAPAPAAVAPAAPAMRPMATAPMSPMQANSQAMPTVVNKPAATAPSAKPAAAAVAAAASDLAGRLNGLGLSKEQVESVLSLSREIVEQVVWEVVPDLAEQLIREEIKRLTAE